MAAIDLTASQDRDRFAADWPQLRSRLVAANEQLEPLYKEVGRLTSGHIRGDANLVAAFLPRSRALLRRSVNLFTYVEQLRRLRGDADARRASAVLIRDARVRCHIEQTHAPTTTIARV